MRQAQHGTAAWPRSHGLASRPRESDLPAWYAVTSGPRALNALDFKKLMIAPVGTPPLPEAVHADAEIYRQLRLELAGRNPATGRGDQGGFAPEISCPKDVLTLLTQAIGEWTNFGYGLLAEAD